MNERAEANVEAACWTRRPEQKRADRTKRATALSWRAAHDAHSLRRRRRRKAAWQSETRHLQHKNPGEGANSGGAEVKQSSPEAARSPGSASSAGSGRGRPAQHATATTEALSAKRGKGLAPSKAMAGQAQRPARQLALRGVAPLDVDAILPRQAEPQEKEKRLWKGNAALLGPRLRESTAPAEMTGRRTRLEQNEKRSRTCICRTLVRRCDTHDLGEKAARAEVEF